LLLHQDMVITTLAFPACSEPAYWFVILSLSLTL
jgi:hypothetical protein